MAVDWLAWHRDYADPDSSLSRRRRVVQEYLRTALADRGAAGDRRAADDRRAPADRSALADHSALIEASPPPPPPDRAALTDRTGMPDTAGRPRLRLVSLCAGDGGDVLPVLAATEQAVNAVLVESNAALADRAAELAAELGPGTDGLVSVSIRTADAGLVDSYAELLPADIVLVCGVFGNISDQDLRRTVAALPGLLVPAGVVIWTRGRGDGQHDAGQAVRELIARSGLTELAFTAPATALFRVGMHRLAPATPRVERPTGQLFSFR